MNKFTLQYNSSPLASLSNLRAKMRKFAIAHAGLKLGFWQSLQCYFAAFEGPMAKMQLLSYSTPGVVYKYV